MHEKKKKKMQEIHPPSESPFLSFDTHAREDTLAILHLRRDLQIPTLLRATPELSDVTGYAEGSVTNTRFGSYPHSTIIDSQWGSQVIASNVDTGSRGRASKKRKADEGDEQQAKKLKTATAASSGFCHVVPPTPESWTASLPHRTQVVYTPDYSFVLQKLRVRPGTVVIEAGAGSGSFTHAAARAVFDGDSSSRVDGQTSERATKRRRTTGRVFSYEYHEPRAKELQTELRDHGLEDVVEVTHRDVYCDGFNVKTTEDSSFDQESEEQVQPTDATAAPSLKSPQATAIFLDLPSPWLALPHLTRQPTDQSSLSPLESQRPVHICAFLPCIEQVTKFITSLRAHSWLEIRMYDLSHKRLDVRRERVGLELEGLRGVNSVAASVEESLQKLLAVEDRGKEFKKITKAKTERDKKTTGLADSKRSVEKGDDLTRAGSPDGNDANDENPGELDGDQQTNHRETKLDRLKRIAQEEAASKSFKDGRLVCRTEPELKQHTSYLVFAVLPRAWSQDDERKARGKWSKG